MTKCHDETVKIPAVTSLSSLDVPQILETHFFSVGVPFNSFQKSDVISIKYDVKIFCPFIANRHLTKDEKTPNFRKPYF